MTTTIRDQRTMVGVRPGGGEHRSVEEVEAAWREWAERNGLSIRVRLGDYSTDLRESDKVVVAYVSGGKWIADCPACNGGIAVWSENPRGCCLDCGTIYRVDHPSEEERGLVEMLLSSRRRVEDRSWLRQRGEPVENLRRENELLAQAGEGDGPEAYSLAEVERILGPQAAGRLRKVAS